MQQATQLLDLLSSSEEEIEPTRAAAGRQALYPEVNAAPFPSSCRSLIFSQYLPQAALVAGVKGGMLHQGNFNANPFNYLEGSVNVPAFSQPILLVGRENMNRSVQGDVVVVEVFDEKEWKAPADEVVDAESTWASLPSAPSPDVCR